MREKAPAVHWFCGGVRLHVVSGPHRTLNDIYPGHPPFRVTHVCRISKIPFVEGTEVIQVGAVESTQVHSQSFDG